MDTLTPVHPQVQSWVLMYSRAALPRPVRALAWVPAAAIGALMTAPATWRWPLIFTAVACVAAHWWFSAMATIRASSLMPTLAQIAAFAGDGDREVVAAAMAKMVVRREYRRAPAPAALAAAVRVVIEDTDSRSCAQGHSRGCVHRRSTGAWRDWLVQHSTRPDPALAAPPVTEVP